MKKILLISIGILVAAISFVGCKKDSDDKANQFQVADDAYAVDSLEMEKIGTITNGYRIWVDLISPDVTVDEEGYWGNHGNIIRFELVSSDMTGIPTGEYVFDETGNEPAFSFPSANYSINWINGSPGSVWTTLASGTVSVSRNGNNYEISYLGTDENGKKVTAYYKGVGKLYTFDKKKSTKANN